ncbi:ankyrin repeat-containing domain protein [Microdochium trichocladiopsis]|uniref:Ankyrin repeat-containing domain protein n=1 Tax=Microdochium trichocladiopsis TaxID=1682393 RepID=A0A9P8YDM1_9PEZI|nr:ankyrin repeat-containing domain protein [Microdochium trichocladiopsis]KAH7037056.1 ankyrin repeat-containing domain protein [Microdochium trichocladiopsis]
MLAERREYIKLTQSNLNDAVRNAACGGDVTELLLTEFDGSSFHVSEEVLAGAAQNPTQGLQAMTALIRHRPREVILTEGVSRAILANSEQGKQISQLLYEQTGQKVQLTRNLVLEAVNSTWSWKWMLPHVLEQGLDAQTLREVVMAAIDKNIKGETIIQSLLGEGTFQVVIDEEMLITVASNPTNAKRLVETLLQHRGEDLLPLPERVLAACMRHPDHGCDLLDLIERHQGLDAIMKTLVDTSCPDLWDFIREPFRVRTLTNTTSGGKMYLDQGQPALWWALLHDQVPLTQQLINMGANLDVNHYDHGPPILIAAVLKNTSMARLLLSSGAKLEPYIDTSIFRYPLRVAVELEDVSMLQALVDHGLDVNKPIAGGTKTALHFAARLGTMPVVELLLARGAQADVYDSQDMTPLHEASARGNTEVVRKLLDQGRADVNCGREGLRLTPLAQAVLFGRVETAKLLLQRGADVRARQPNGYTLLHSAAGWGHVEAVALLLEYGADMNATTEDGETPKDWAQKRGRDAVVAFFTAHAQDQDWVKL